MEKITVEEADRIYGIVPLYDSKENEADKDG